MTQLPEIEAGSPACDCIPIYIELLWKFLPFREKIKYIQLHIQHIIEQVDGLHQLHKEQNNEKETSKKEAC